MKDKVLMRLKQTAKLEKLLKEGAPYEKILQQSKKVDKYIVEEMNSTKIKY